MELSKDLFDSRGNFLSKKATKEESLAFANMRLADKFGEGLYECQEFTGTKKPTVIKCLKCGNEIKRSRFTAFLDTKGCGVCRGRMYNRAKFLNKANEIHGDKYSYENVGDVSALRGHRAIIVCPEHGEFEQDLESHIGGRGCPKCAHKYFDRIYLWRLSDTNVYKVGVTTTAKRQERITQVANKHNVTPHILLLEHTEHASTIEQEVLSRFKDYKATGITGDGYTEMLELVDSQVDEVEAYIRTAIKDLK